jgi:hypothetical protein
MTDAEAFLMWIIPTEEENTFECISVEENRENPQAGGSTPMRLVKFRMNENGVLVMGETEDTDMDLD